MKLRFFFFFKVLFIFDVSTKGDYLLSHLKITNQDYMGSDIGTYLPLIRIRFRSWG